MKKINSFILLITFTGALVTSCESDKEDPPVEIDYTTSSITATVPQIFQNFTADFDTGLEFSWSENDRIAVSYFAEYDPAIASNNVAYEILTGEAGRKAATFGSSEELTWSTEYGKNHIYGFYPAEDVESFQSNMAVTTVKTRQIQYNLNDYNHSNGFFTAHTGFDNYSDGVGMQFTFPLSLLKFTIDAEGTMLQNNELIMVQMVSDIDFAGEITYEFENGTMSDASEGEIALTFEERPILTKEAKAWINIIPTDFTPYGANLKLKIVTQYYTATIGIDPDKAFAGGRIYEIDLKLKELIDQGLCDVVFTGAGELVSSNCYMLKPGEFVYIPIKRAYDVWRDYIGKDISTYAKRAKMFWEDTVGLLDDVTLLMEEEGENAVIRVQAGSRPGNASVGLDYLDSEDPPQYLWNWHIWVTDFDPEEPGGTTTYNNTVFMNRNLGALSNTPGDRLSAGFLYQWGRKDPLPGAHELFEYTEAYHTYTDDGNRVITNKWAVQEENNLENSILYPFAFYGSLVSPWDWYTTNADMMNDYLWNDEQDRKTVFDPCPDGWRVPVSDHNLEGGCIWYNPAATTDRGYNPNEYVNDVDGDWISGWNFTMDGYALDYYPAAGYLYSRTGAVEMVNTYGNYWSAVGQGATSSRFHFAKTYVWPDSAASRSFGHSVRCVRE